MRTYQDYRGRRDMHLVPSIAIVDQKGHHGGEGVGELQLWRGLPGVGFLFALLLALLSTAQDAYERETSVGTPLGLGAQNGNCYCPNGKVPRPAAVKSRKWHTEVRLEMAGCG